MVWSSRVALGFTVLAKDGIAVIVSNDNPTDNLTVDQIKGIYTGELTTWADVQ